MRLRADRPAARLERCDPDGRRAPAGPGRRGSRLVGRWCRQPVADCTVGGGGHAERLLEATSPDGRLLGLDADRAAISEATHVLARFGDRVVLRHANFEAIYAAANEAGFVPLDGVLFDLGLSSYQLADPRRGFSFAADAPPDMRFDESVVYRPSSSSSAPRGESSPESSRRLVKNAVLAASRRRSWRRVRRAGS